MFTRLDFSSALEYSIIRRYTNIVYYYIELSLLVVTTLLASESYLHLMAWSQYELQILAPLCHHIFIVFRWFEPILTGHQFFTYFFEKERLIEINKNYIQDSRKKTLKIQ